MALNPHDSSISTKTLYSLAEIKALLSSYTNSNSLMSPANQAYVNLDGRLVTCLSAKPSGKSKTISTEPEPSSGPSGTVKREELIKKVLDKMQSWYEVNAGQEEVVRK